MKTTTKRNTALVRKEKVSPSRPAPAGARVSLELVEPRAKAVFLAGTFNQWTPERTPMKRDAKGRWKAGLTVEPGRHEYLFVVDGNWVPDPRAVEAVQNPFGGINSILTVSA